MPIVIGLLVIMVFVVVTGTPAEGAEDLYYDAEYEVVEEAEEEGSSEQVAESSAESTASPLEDEGVDIDAAALAKDLYDDFGG